jgi:hypothetical protein
VPRSGLKNSRKSLTHASGASIGAKWPPASATFLTNLTKPIDPEHLLDAIAAATR